MREGLFEDEANAMLNTWKHSYFKQPGSRVFFIVPKIWVNHHLPISLNVDAKIDRAMIGRIELMSEFQFNNLKLLRDAKLKKEDFEQLLIAELRDLGKSPEKISPKPIFYQNYLKLGRFRDAFLFDANKTSPNENFQYFLNKLQYY
jgi:hypothetical protein